MIPRNENIFCKALSLKCREEGILSFWKGNGANMIRVFPYAAAQLSSNDFYKRLFVGPSGDLSVLQRLSAGACAGMTATALTHPIDTVRLRLAMPTHPYKGAALHLTMACGRHRAIACTACVCACDEADAVVCNTRCCCFAGLLNAFVTIARTEGPLALYKGLGPTLVGIAPYAALNFASYDLAKKWFYHGGKPQGTVQNLLLGAATGTFAATVCYPLDTVRRRMQMKGKTYNGQIHAMTEIWAKVYRPSQLELRNLPSFPSIVGPHTICFSVVHVLCYKCKYVVQLMRLPVLEATPVSCAGGHAWVLPRLDRKYSEGRAAKQHTLCGV